MDTIDKARRSWVMSRVRSKDTVPELAVRRLVFAMGFRYRLHGRHLPGTPDLVFAGRKKVIFVHGCFWHRHTGCKLARMPKSRLEFWMPKLERNRERDREEVKALRAIGWKSLVVWECQLSKESVLRGRLRRFLEGEVPGERT